MTALDIVYQLSAKSAEIELYPRPPVTPVSAHLYLRTDQPYKSCKACHACVYTTIWSARRNPRLFGPRFFWLQVKRGKQYFVAQCLGERGPESSPSARLTFTATCRNAVWPMY